MKGCARIGSLLCLLLMGQSPQVFARSYNCHLPGFILPLSGQIVPRNTKIWIGGGPYAWGATRPVEQGRVKLRGPTNEIGLDFASIETEEFVITILLPRAQLDADSTYELLLLDSMGWTPVLTFDTSDELDSEPPEVPEVTVTDVVNNGCANGAEIDIETDGDFVVLNHTGTTLDPRTLNGDVSVLQPAHQQVWFGREKSVCGRTTWEYAKLRSRTDVRAGVFDLAGNFSGWSQPEELGLYGCRFEQKSTMAGVVAMLLLLFGIGRRRK